MSVNNENNNLVRLGDYIELIDARNADLKYGISDVCGISNNKEIMPTRANVEGTELHNFVVVEQEELIYNSRTTRMGDKIGLGFNDTGKILITSWNNTAFRVKSTSKDVLLPLYLFVYFKRAEFDRYTRYNSWGSSTEIFSWDSMCDIQIPVPSIEVQRELVATYNGLKALAEQNEALIKPLTEACQAYIVDCKRKYPEVEVVNFIKIYDKINIDAKKLPFCGINKDKTFMPTVANTNELDNSKYKVVEKEVFVFSGMQTGRDVCIRLALYDKDEPILVSPAYTTFVIKDKLEILPQYFFIQFNRFEMDRYGWFLSDGSIRSNLDWSEFCRIKIPLPPPEVQQAIVNLYHCAEEAKNIAGEAREKIKILCPALVQKAIKG